MDSKNEIERMWDLILSRTFLFISGGRSALCCLLNLSYFTSCYASLVLILKTFSVVTPTTLFKKPNRLEIVWLFYPIRLPHWKTVLRNQSLCRNAFCFVSPHSSYHINRLYEVVFSSYYLLISPILEWKKIFWNYRW